MSENYTVLKHYGFRDHHAYQASDLEDILHFSRTEKAALVCTEKDWVKLSRLNIIAENELYYLPVAHSFFANNGAKFERLVSDKWRLAN